MSWQIETQIVCFAYKIKFNTHQHYFYQLVDPEKMRDFEKWWVTAVGKLLLWMGGIDN